MQGSIKMLNFEAIYITTNVLHFNNIRETNCEAKHSELVL